ncbi:DNA-directed RNA polymerase subunit beta [Candidatus Levyibacteriota bacterium]|nr:DNA-directed RNA polymerase subunit beta [Candidatus Levybacteria bacterium]GDX62343.1 DNA-directed RNA polymerase subunit beta [Candidatus Levybacteria bacterium]
MQKTDLKENIRQNWGKTYSALPIMDLLAIQKRSYEWFQDVAIGETLREISPIDDFTEKNWSLEFGEYRFGKASTTPQNALVKGITFDCPLYVKATLTNKKTEKRQTQEVFLGDIPQMTERATFIVNGIERAVVNQLVRSPGSFFTSTLDAVSGKTLYSAEIRPIHGSWLEFSTTRHNTITVKIDRRRKFLATTFLKALGMSSSEVIEERFEEVSATDNDGYINNTLMKDETQGEVDAVIEIFKKMHPGEPIVLEKVKDNFNGLFFNNRRYDLGRVGRYKLNKKLNNIPGFSSSDTHVLTIEDIIGTIKYLILLTQGKGVIDDIDSLANRRVRSVGELVATTAFRVGILRLERSVKERMSLIQADTPVSIANLVNARPIMASINEFFRTSQLSTILDQTNPLSEIDNLRRVTVMGTGGISRERAAFSIRDINSSQYSRVCPIRSPEGPNIGLVTYLSLYARMNEYGFLEAPYRKVQITESGKKFIVKVTDEIHYLSSDDEAERYISHAMAVSDDNIIVEDRVAVRYRGEFIEVEKEKIEYVDVLPRQVVGVAASLIPFVSHDEANRALMGTHMQCQAVPLVKPESPMVGTGMESAIAEVMGRVIRAPFDGIITSLDADTIVLEGKAGEKASFAIKAFQRTSQATSYSQRVIAKLRQQVVMGDVLVDGPAAQNGELALGQNLLIAYASFDGLGYEDAIVISDRLVREDILSSIHIEKYEAAVVETKLGPEETTRDIPNVAEEDLSSLDEEGIIVVGSEISPGDILVGKIAPKGETELTAEERLLRAIFGEQSREVRDTSLRMPHGERGTIISVQILDRKKGDEMEPGTMRKIIIEAAQFRHVVVGDKLAGRHGNKGVISKILPESDMPHLKDGTTVDILISPISVLARMNLGQLLEAHLGWAASKLNIKIGAPVFEQISEDRITSLLKKAGLPVDGKAILVDGRTGKEYENPVVVGIEYIMKLIHMVEDKTHARSTGPYSLVTQQPLGGKAQMGGQRLGEMEVWALEAHRARYILQEMLTIKSDDVVGRSKAFEAIVKGLDIPTPKVPESFKVLIKELQAMGLNVVPVGAMVNADLPQAENIVEDNQNIKIEEDAKELREELGGVEVAEVSMQEEVVSEIMQEGLVNE